MISFRVEEAEMLIENKDRFLKTKPMLAENPKTKPMLGENPKTKPITDLKRDFRLLGRWLWFFFCNCDFFLWLWLFFCQLLCNLCGFIFIYLYIPQFSSIFIHYHPDWAVVGFPRSTLLRSDKKQHGFCFFWIFFSETWFPWRIFF